MDIFTERVCRKKYSEAIEPELLKHSQEYYVLAVLRYLCGSKYQNSVLSESPDIQDKSSLIGIEVTVASLPGDMKVSREFTKMRRAMSLDEYKKTKSKIEKEGYSVLTTPIGVERLQSPMRTESTDRKCLEEAIRRKLKKINSYRLLFQELGLAIVFHDLVSSRVELNGVAWIRDYITNFTSDQFDFYYVFCNRAVLFYDTGDGTFEKKTLSKDEREKLACIGRMTAEGELNLSDVEWQNSGEEPT